MAMRRYVPACRDALLASEADPTLWKAYWRQGTALMLMTQKKFRTEQAIKAFEQCLRCQTLVAAAQRKKVAAMWEARGAMIDIAVTTPSAMVRGVITALNWFLSRPARAFATLREAMEEVGASPSQQPELIVAMEQLKDQVR